MGREELYRAVNPAELRAVKEFMREKPLFDDEWRNMLILGDNLPVLRALLQDGRVCGKVKLIYIDPQFCTSFVYRGKGHVRTGP